MNADRLLAIGLAAALLVVAWAPTAAASDPRDVACDDDGLGRYVQVQVLCEGLICVQEGIPCIDHPPVRDLLRSLTT